MFPGLENHNLPSKNQTRTIQLRQTHKLHLHINTYLNLYLKKFHKYFISKKLRIRGSKFQKSQRRFSPFLNNFLVKSPKQSFFRQLRELSFQVQVLKHHFQLLVQLFEVIVSLPNSYFCRPIRKSFWKYLQIQNRSKTYNQ